MIERYYKEIRVEFERQKVHIYARKPLYDFLEQKSKKDALVLSEYILRDYKKLYGRELKISRDSMAVEILIHVYVDKVLKRIEAKEHAREQEGIHRKLAQICEGLQVHTGIIDCGEKEVDSNRIVFDGLVPFKGMIFKLLE